MAKAIVKELDHLPLPIEHAAALIQLNRFSLENFLSGYQQHYQRLSAERIPKGLLKYEKSLSLFTLIEMLYSTIQKEYPEAAALLNLTLQRPRLRQTPPALAKPRYSHYSP